MKHERDSKLLPEGVEWAYDGLVVSDEVGLTALSLLTAAGRLGVYFLASAYPSIRLRP